MMMSEPINNIQSCSWLNALAWFCRRHGIDSHSDSLLIGLPLTQEQLTPNFDEALFLRAAESTGFSVDKRSVSSSLLTLLPIVAYNTDKAWIITEKTVAGFSAINCSTQENTTLIEAELLELEAMIVSFEQATDERASEHYQPPKAHWLVSAIKEVKPWYRDLLVASFVINLLALVIPLFTMNVYDRVIPNAAFHTLWVLAGGAFIIIIFDWLLRHARTYIGDIAGKQIDLKVSALLFSKVLGMRLEKRPQSAASYAKQVQEFDSVREFFTSATLVSAIDLPFTVLFLGLMAWLGGAMVFIPITIMLALFTLAWLIKTPLNEAVDESSKLSTQRQAHLID